MKYSNPNWPVLFCLTPIYLALLYLMPVSIARFCNNALLSCALLRECLCRCAFALRASVDSPKYIHLLFFCDRVKLFWLCTQPPFFDNILGSFKSYVTQHFWKLTYCNRLIRTCRYAYRGFTVCWHSKVCATQFLNDPFVKMKIWQ